MSYVSMTRSATQTKCELIMLLVHRYNSTSRAQETLSQLPTSGVASCPGAVQEKCESSDTPNNASLHKRRPRTSGHRSQFMTVQPATSPPARTPPHLTICYHCSGLPCPHSRGRVSAREGKGTRERNRLAPCLAAPFPLASTPTPTQYLTPITLFSYRALASGASSRRPSSPPRTRTRPAWSCPPPAGTRHAQSSGWGSSRCSRRR